MVGETFSQYPHSSEDPEGALMGMLQILIEELNFVPTFYFERL